MEPDESKAGSDRIVIGYHGTSAERMAEILRQGFKISQNDWDWLGHGVYFWEGHIRALEWAAKFGQQAAVIQAKIKLGVCLDLCDSGYLDVIRKAYERLKESYEKQGVPLPDNKGKLRTLDCLVFNYLATEIWPVVDTVRSVFMEGEEIYPGTKLRTRQHIQLCVRNLDCILEVNTFLAR